MYENKETYWDNEFPDDWKITTQNKDKNISHFVLYSFIKLHRNKVFIRYGNPYAEIINSIFPKVHPDLFKVFLLLYFSGNNIKYTVDNGNNFSIFNDMNGVIFNSLPNEEDNRKKANRLLKEQESKYKKETIEIILNFFTRKYSYWTLLKYYQKDLTGEEKQNIVKRVRLTKLEQLKNEIESDETKKFCKDSGPKENCRKDLQELVELLILELEK